MRTFHRTTYVATLAVAAALVAGHVSGSSADSSTNAADKVAFAGSRVQVIGPQAAVTVLSKTFKTSTPADLILELTAECAITTDLTTTGNDVAEAIATVRMWIQIDGRPVPITDAPGDDGKVVFCNRMYRRETANFDDEDATIRTFMRTRQANAFNWLALNVGNGIHKLEVKAELTQATQGDATALAAVGNRSITVDPTHLPPDANRESN